LHPPLTPSSPSYEEKTGWLKFQIISKKGEIKKSKSSPSTKWKDRYFFRVVDRNVYYFKRPGDTEPILGQFSLERSSISVFDYKKKLCIRIVIPCDSSTPPLCKGSVGLDMTLFNVYMLTADTESEVKAWFSIFLHRSAEGEEGGGSGSIERSASTPS